MTPLTLGSVLDAMMLLIWCVCNVCVLCELMLAKSCCQLNGSLLRSRSKRFAHSSHCAVLCCAAAHIDDGAAAAWRPQQALRQQLLHHEKGPHCVSHEDWRKVPGSELCVCMCMRVCVGGDCVGGGWKGSKWVLPACAADSRMR